MSEPTPLTDRDALIRNRARARQNPAFFLLKDIAAEVHERLIEVNRTFTAPIIVTGFPDIWREIAPNAGIIEDSDTLDLAPQSHDLIIHAMCLHWANDPVGQLIQCRRALKPDGMLICVLLGGQTLNELRAVLSEAEASVTGGLSPRVAPMAEIRDLGGLLQRAGLALPVADVTPRTVTYANMFGLINDLRGMGETSALAQRNKRIPPRTIFAKAAALYAKHFPATDNRINATFEVITLTGWAPDDSQQKPLKPGSAAHRLADALGTDETPLPDDATEKRN